MGSERGTDLAVDRQVIADRYRVEELLGRGGMAEVYRATDTVLDRTVAVKVLPTWLSADPTYVERFRREAQAAARLNHPNVVGVYDTGSDDGIKFIVMEYAPGRTLEEVLADEAPLPPERAVAIAAAVATALSAAHQQGLVHRDVKPGNVMISPEGEVKVMDFGIARGIASQTLTQTGTVFGTATYLSPEQARGGPVDARSDLYSLGVVLFEMLAGRPPFEGETAMAVATKHLTEEPPSLRSIAPQVDPGLEAVTAKAMAKAPDDRHRSADELREELAKAARGVGPAVAAPVAAPTGGAADAATTAPIAPTGTAVLPATTPAGGPPRHGSRRTTPTRRWPVVALVVVGLLLLGLLVVAALAGGNDPLRGARRTPGSTEPVQTPTTTSPQPTAPTGDPVFLAAAGLEEVVNDGIISGDIDPEAGRKILESIGKAKAAYASGDPDKAIEELDHLRDEVRKMFEKGDIVSQVTAASILQGIDDLAELIQAESPPADEGDEGDGGDEGKGKGKGHDGGDEGGD